MGSPGHIPISDRLDIQGLLEEIRRQLPRLEIKRVQEQIDAVLKSEPSRSFIAVITHDTLRTPYIWFRVFESGDSRASYKSAELSNHPIPLRNAT